MLPADVLRCLAHNLDPATGKLLRPHAKDGDRVGMDFTFNAPKSVSIARELAGEGNEGDSRVEAAHREAVSYAVGLIERDMKTRVRAGGANTDRETGELFAYRVTHRDTRTLPSDRLPDMHLHDHVFCLNLTFDPVEQKYKAAQLGDIKHDAPFYEAAYMNRLASNLREIGYGVRREGKAFEVAGIDRKLIEKFSRRTAEVERVAKKLGIKNPASKAKLGATTRQGKTKETVEELNAYYAGRLTTVEKERLAHLQFEPSYESDAGMAVAFAVGHEFERRSVVEAKKLYETALRHGIGSVTLEDVTAEAERQGVLVRGKDCTTRAVLAEETRIIDFAREGKGACRPLGTGLPENKPVQAGVTRLSTEQTALVDHILTSTDRVVLARGGAGTGKTTALKAAMDGVDCPKAVLAPTVPAARDVLRQDFPNANTVAAYLQDRKWQERTRGGVILVDEAAAMAIKDLSRLCDVAKEQNARLLLIGDPRQHKSVLRSGNMFHVLQEYAGLPLAELKDIRRQSGRYKEAVAAIESGDVLKGHDIFTELKWVKQADGDKPLVDDYFAALATKRPGQADRDRAIVLAPTHAAGEAITGEIRTRLRAAGKLGGETEVRQLVSLHWSEPERGDLGRYDGSEVMVFRRNSGTFKAGQVVRVADWKPADHFKSPEHFEVYRETKLALAPGDVVTTTANVKDALGRRVDNGSFLTVVGVSAKGIEVETGKTRRLLPPDVAHLRHGYYSTSIGGQGRTVDKVFAAMGADTLPALRTEQFYVDLSRGRFQATIYTDVPADRLREAIQRTDTRKSATELMTPRRKPKASRVKGWMAKARDRFKKLHELVRPVTKEREREKEYAHER